MPIIVRIIPVGPFIENAYLIGSEESGICAVIDPGAEVDKILKTAEEVKLTIKVILNTHGHLDHIAAVKAVKDATQASYQLHTEELPLLQQDHSQGMMSNPQFNIPEFQPPPEPDRLLQDGDEVEVGDLKLKVLHTPGHTAGSACYYGHGMVFTGDTLFQLNVGRTQNQGLHAQMMEGIRSKLMTLPDETVVLPGHGGHSSIGTERKWNPFLRGKGLLF